MLFRQHARRRESRRHCRQPIFHPGSNVVFPSNIALNPAFATSAGFPFTRRFEHPAFMATAISFRYET